MQTRGKLGCHIVCQGQQRYIGRQPEVNLEISD